MWQSPGEGRERGLAFVRMGVRNSRTKGEGGGGGRVLYRLKISAQSQSNQPIDSSLNGTIEPSMNSIFISFLLFGYVLCFKKNKVEKVACALLMGRI